MSPRTTRTPGTRSRAASSQAARLTASTRTATKVLSAGALGAALACGSLAGAGAAVASTPAPTAPTGLKVTAAYRSGFTVSLHRSAHASTYRVYTSTLKADLYESAINRPNSRRTFAAATSPRITVSGLRYTTSPYYFRVEVTNGKRHKWSAVSTYGARLAPATPSSLSVVAGSQGAPTLQWAGGAATGFQVRQSTSSDFSSDVRTYTGRGPDVRFTPAWTTSGRTYYFRVRALNGGTPSAFSDVVSTTVHARMEGLRTLTYNVRSAGLAHDAAPWSKRLPGVVGFIKAAKPDVFALQEAGSHVHGVTRQVDQVAAHLPGYKIANTDTMPDGSIQRSYGNYVVYMPSAMSPITKGGQWVLGDNRYAAYQAFRTAGGARLLAVSAHLSPGAGTTADNERKRETSALVESASSYASRIHVTSIVYLGDFNSFLGRWHTVDTPGNIMRAHHMTDAKLAAQRLYNARYSSINNYKRIAPVGGGASDHAYVSPGVGVASWGEMLHVRHGKFVGVIPSDHNPVWSELLLPVSTD